MTPPVVYLYPETSVDLGPMMFELAPGSALTEILPRIARTKLLDGTTHFDNRGATDGDRTIRIRARITAAQVEALRGRANAGERFYLVADEAVWIGHIAKITAGGGDGTIEYWPETRIADASTIEYPDAYVAYSVSLPLSGWNCISFSDDTKSDANSVYILIGGGYKASIRFMSTIPAGATIQAAVVRFTSFFTQGGDFTYTLRFWERADQDALPTTWADIPDYTGFNEMTPTVSWPITAWTGGNVYDSPDMAAILQEVVDLAGYASGNSIMFYGYYSGAGSRWANKTPTLEVTYST